MMVHHFNKFQASALSVFTSFDYVFFMHISHWFRNSGVLKQTPLDLAYQKGDPDISIVQYLIEKGANVGLKPVFEGKSECCYNFLDWAIERKHRYLHAYSYIE